MSVAYNPSARFEIKTWDTEFRRIPPRTLMARVYQPQGAGPGRLQPPPDLEPVRLAPLQYGED